MKKTLLLIFLFFFITIVCSISVLGVNCTSYSYGNWSFSEHIRSGTLDETWEESNTSDWEIGWSDILNLNYTYQFNNTDGLASQFGYTILNSSGMNRSQSLVWTHTNDSSNQIFLGEVYAYRNTSSFDAVLHGATETFLLTWNGTGLTNTNDSTPVTSYADAYNYWTSNWGWLDDDYYYEAHPWAETGTWIKTIYNEHCGRIQSKIWGHETLIGLMHEPAGWIVDAEITNATYTTCQGKGLCVWNPYDVAFTADFDIYEVWQLNYSLNTTSSINISGTSHSRPHMDFPILNYTNLYNNLVSYIDDAESGNLTLDNLSDHLRYGTNNLSMESRAYNPSSINSNDQNDTIYYYSGAITDYFTWFYNTYPGETPPTNTSNNMLWLYIEDACDDDATTQSDAALVVIDVDNDHSWDSNDRAFYWNDDLTDTWEWDGDGPRDWRAVADAEISPQSAPRNLHRYEQHMWYNIFIPMDDLVKSDGTDLNSSDVFGLHIMSINSADSNIAVWENWNETNCSTFISEDSITILDSYLNSTTISSESSLDLSSTHMWLFGEGAVGSGTLNSTSNYGISINKTANISLIQDHTYFHVNFSINVTNTQDGTLTNVWLNETWMNCSCSDFKWYLVDNSSWFDWSSNVTHYNDSCNLSIHLPDLVSGYSWNLWFIVNITECTTPTYATINNTATVTTAQSYTASSTTLINWNYLTSILRVIGKNNNANALSITSTVASIIGVAILISAILLIVGILYFKKPY